METAYIRVVEVGRVPPLTSALIEAKKRLPIPFLGLLLSCSGIAPEAGQVLMLHGVVNLLAK